VEWWNNNIFIRGWRKKFYFIGDYKKNNILLIKEADYYLIQNSGKCFLVEIRPHR